MDLKKTAKTGKVAFLEANKIKKEKRNNQHHTPISYNSDGLQISKYMGNIFFLSFH